MTIERNHFIFDTMKTITTQNKWFMSLNIAGQLHGVLFDGKNVYDDCFPEEKIERIPTCFGTINQEQLSNVCQEKMKELKVIFHNPSGEYIAIKA